METKNITNTNFNNEISKEELQYINNIVNCLEKTFKSSDKEIRKQAEKFLKQVEINLFPHLIHIFNFIKQKTITKELCNALLIFIRNSIISKKKSNLLSKENYIELIMLIVNIIVDPGYPSECLREMNKIFEEIIDNKEFIKDKTIMKDFMSLFASKLKNGLIQIYSYKSLAYIYENILSSNCIDSSNCEYFIQLALNGAEQMLQNIIDLLGKIDINKANNSEIENNILYYLETVKILFELVLLISIMTQNQFDNFNKFGDTLMNYFFDSGLKILTINYAKLEEAIMKMKTKILRFVNSIVLNIPHCLLSKDKKLIERHKNLITFCIESLKAQNILFFNNDISNEKTLIEKFDVQIIIYLYKMIFDSPFSNELSKYLPNITNGIIFPLLISSEEEISNLENDPYGNNYANFIYDLVTKKSLKQLKTTVSKFISIGCKSNEKYLQFIICYSIDIIQLCINIPKEKTIESSLINQNDVFIFNDKINEINKVEVSFLTLCIIYKVISKKNNKINYYKVIFSFIQNNLKSVINKFVQNSIIKQRICLFLSLYIKDFIDVNIDLNLFKDICEFLFFNIFNEKHHIAAYESFDAITKILTNKNFKNEITYYLSKKYYEKILSYIETYTNPLFFDMLSEIIYSIEDLDDLLKLLGNLFIRIKKEMSEITPRRISQNNYNDMMQQEKSPYGKTNYRLIISKCFSVLHKIFKNENLILKKYEQIEKYIEPLMKYMRTPNKIDFDDDLINIIIVIIRTLKYLPNLAINLLPDIGQVLRKNKGMTKNLFILTNLYIIYSKGEIENTEDNSKYIFKLYKKCFSKDSFNKESAYLCTIIIEIWFIICNIIPQKTVQNIITFAYERLQDIYFGAKQSHSDTAKIIFDSQILGLGLTNLILSCYVHYSKYVPETIKLKEIVQYASYIPFSKFNYSLYENKIFILSLCSILKNKDLNNNIINDEIPKIISYCYNVLRKIRKKELKNNINNESNNNINIINKNKIKEEEDEEIKIDEDDEEVDQDQKKNDKIKNKKLKIMYNLDIEMKKNIYETFNNDNLNYNKNYDINVNIKDFNYKEIDNIIFCPPIKKENIYKFFVQTLEIIKSENNDIFCNYYNNLTNEEKKHLQEIIEISKEFQL